MALERIVRGRPPYWAHKDARPTLFLSASMFLNGVYTWWREGFKRAILSFVSSGLLILSAKEYPHRDAYIITSCACAFTGIVMAIKALFDSKTLTGREAVLAIMAKEAMRFNAQVLYDDIFLQYNSYKFELYPLAHHHNYLRYPVAPVPESIDDSYILWSVDEEYKSTKYVEKLRKKHRASSPYDLERIEKVENFQDIKLPSESYDYLPKDGLAEPNPKSDAYFQSSMITLDAWKPILDTYPMTPFQRPYPRAPANLDRETYEIFSQQIIAQEILKNPHLKYSKLEALLIRIVHGGIIPPEFVKDTWW